MNEWDTNAAEDEVPGDPAGEPGVPHLKQFIPLHQAAQRVLQNATYQRLWPDLCKLLMIVLVPPVTSVTCERSFCSMK